MNPPSVTQALSYQSTWFGILRIGIVAIITLFSIGYFYPLPDEKVGWNNISSPSKVYTMARPMDDPRGFRRLDSESDTGKFEIAWISGSGTQVIWPQNVPKPEVNEFMPMFVQPKLAAALGKDVSIFLYVMQSGSAIDKYFALVDAIRRKVDFIVYEVNPAYDFSAKLLTRRQNLSATPARVAFTDTKLAIRVLTLAAPMDIAGALVQYRLPAIGDRWSYNKIIRQYAAVPVPVVKPAPRDPSPAQSKMAAAADAWTFWASYGQNPPDFWKGRVNPCAQPSSDGKSGWCGHIDAAMAFSRPDLYVGSSRVTQENVKFLMSTAIPSLIYLSPIAPIGREQPAMKAQYDSMQELLLSLGTTSGPATYCIKPGYSAATLRDQAFGDSIHLKKSEPMASEMAWSILGWVKEAKCR